MVLNKLKKRNIGQGKHGKYTKRKGCARVYHRKNKKHYTRKYGKRIQRRRQTRSKRGGELTLNIPNMNTPVTILYQYFARITKPNVDSFSEDDNPEQIIMYTKQDEPNSIFIARCPSKDCSTETGAQIMEVDDKSFIKDASKREYGFSSNGQKYRMRIDDDVGSVVGVGDTLLDVFKEYTIPKESAVKDVAAAAPLVAPVKEVAAAPDVKPPSKKLSDLLNSMAHENMQKLSQLLHSMSDENMQKLLQLLDSMSDENMQKLLQLLNSMTTNNLGIILQALNSKFNYVNKLGVKGPNSTIAIGLLLDIHLGLDPESMSKLLDFYSFNEIKQFVYPEPYSNILRYDITCHKYEGGQTPLLKSISTGKEDPSTCKAIKALNKIILIITQFFKHIKGKLDNVDVRTEYDSELLEADNECSGRPPQGGGKRKTLKKRRRVKK